MPTSVSDSLEKSLLSDADKSEVYTGESHSDSENSPPNEITQLREILIEADTVGNVLPSAVVKSSEKDGRLAEATLPIVEENIKESARRNPKILSDAIAPLIGPAVRKAIAEALSQMVQSLNQTLDHSFSPQGIRWRLESMRTGKPFGEIVMLNTLLYRVEQVFLIHKNTGLLLNHVAIEQEGNEDGDMISSMLTAIEDFVQDSFKTGEEATLDSLKVKDLSIWIEHSRDGILAAVIRGNAPFAFRETLSETMENIQYKQEKDFTEFSGDNSVFKTVEPDLRQCLQMQLGEGGKPKTQIFRPLNIIAAVLGLIFLTATVFYGRDYFRWRGFINRLKTEPGYVLTENDYGFFSKSVSGLRDDLADDSTKILQEYNVNSDEVSQVWRPFHDAAPQFVLQRAEKILSPGKGIKLSFENGILTASGNASPEWIADARRLSQTLVGVKEFRFNNDSAKAEAGFQKIFFNCGTADFAAGQAEKLNEAVKNAETLLDSNTNVSIKITGYAAPGGSAELNARLSRERAEKTEQYLFEKSPKLNALKNNFEIESDTDESAEKECVVKINAK